MKIFFKLPKTLTLRMLIFLIITGVSCKDHKYQEEKVQMEDDESFAGSSKREDICQLLTEDNIRSVFELSNEIEIEQSESHETICSYGWWAPNIEHFYYSVSLNFARGGKRTNSQIDAIWKSQNEALYDRHQLQDVSGVGDKASWSKLGGGQLRVASNGSIFYVSLKLTKTTSLDKDKKSPMDTQAMIDKASALAKKVIDRM